VRTIPGLLALSECAEQLMRNKLQYASALTFASFAVRSLLETNTVLAASTAASEHVWMKWGEDTVSQRRHPRLTLFKEANLAEYVCCVIQQQIMK
jgi:hypothetical protein